MSLLKSILNMLFKTAVDSLNQKEERPQVSNRNSGMRSARPAERPADRREITDWNAYFAEILATEFPQYSVKRNVPVTELAGDISDEAQLYKTRPVQQYRAEWGTPYTFVLYQGEAPVGIVMLGSDNSHQRKVKYLVSRMFAKKLGLPYINFYTQMPNERDYVISRINKFLNA